MMKNNLGYEEGEICGRNGCQGVIEFSESKNCSCHINPPCGSCMSVYLLCSDCDWNENDDPTVIKDAEGAISFDPQFPLVFVEKYKRILDPTKIDYVIKMHSSSSQLCEGVYPENTTREEVEAVVRGTFGGRFESFKDGKFKYIAYTD